MERNVKRITIISVYLIILAAFAVFIYLQVKPKANCFDGKQNQSEEGVDCGGVCVKKCQIVAQKSLIVEQAGFVPSGVANSFDLYAVVSNPNQTLGSGGFGYQFSVKNSAGTIIGTMAGSNFILPGETKYIVESNLSLSEVPAAAELLISDPRWDEANEFYERPQLKIVNKKYEEITGGIGFSQATGLLKNESPLDFSNIKLKVILKDGSGRVVALNSTEMNMVKAGENRDFKVSWPSRFPGTVVNMDVQPEANVFSSEAFFKKYFKPQQF